MCASARSEQQYNSQRPHSRLGYLTPLAFKTAWLEAQANLEILSFLLDQLMGLMTHSWCNPIYPPS